jgi:dTDP-4-amino-4,6-dideoxygalactose transaminase
MRVVFADVDSASYTLDLADVERRITGDTRAIVAVHLYGHPCDMDGLGAIARRHGLRIIEDCAQAHGAEYRGRRVGAIGDVGAFSFYPGKNLGAYGDAGAVLTDDADLAKRCRMIANHGRTGKYDHEFEGRNSRLDGLQAAILSAKLRHLDRWVARRNEVATRYLRQLAGLGDLVLPSVAPDVRHAFHLFVVRTRFRDSLAEHLAEYGVQTGVHYPVALPRLAAYRHVVQSTEGMFACRADRQVLSLPMGEHLSDTDVDEVCEAVASFNWR